MVRWPVLETGRNSVSPSTTPSTSAVAGSRSGAHAATPDRTRRAASASVRSDCEPLVEVRRGRRRRTESSRRPRRTPRAGRGPVRAARSATVWSMNSNGTAAAASRCWRSRKRSCTALRGLARSPSGGERVVEVLLAAAHAADVERGVARAAGPRPRSTSSPTTTGTRGDDVEPAERSPAGPRPAATRAARIGSRLARRARARRRSPASRRRSRRSARGSSGRPRRGRAGSRARTGWTVSRSALPGPSGSGSVKCSPSYCDRSRGAAPCRTISTYSRVRGSGWSKRTPCQPSETCGPDTPEPEPEPAAGQGVERRGGHRRHRRGAGRDLEDGRADVDPLGLRGDPGEHRGGVGAVRLGRPARPRSRAGRPRGPGRGCRRRCPRPSSRGSVPVAWAGA